MFCQHIKSVTKTGRKRAVLYSDAWLACCHISKMEECIQLKVENIITDLEKKKEDYVHKA